ncbi:MAG TPA: N-acetylmuramoyl-L-alanine amidase [Thermoanaerobaculia bacterium]|nr:N-acetylmuramoyl-L-alanine amidase [Thermoanaerobaculia bacterium]
MPGFQLVSALVIEPDTGQEPAPLASAVPPIKAGQKLQLELTPERVVNGVNVFEGVAISVEGVPPDSQLSITPNPAQSFQPFLLTIDTSFSTTPNTYKIKVDGTSTRDQQAYDPFVLLLAVMPAPRRVALAVTPPSQTLKSGTTATYAVALARTPTSQRLEVTLSLSGILPAGATSRFEPPKPTGNTASLIITTLPTTPTSTSALIVKGSVTVEDGKVVNAPPVVLKTFIPTVAVQARNRLLTFDDPVQECTVELRGGTALLSSTVTDQSGMAQLPLPGVEDGVYQVAFQPKYSSLDPVGPSLAATEPRPDRIWRPLGVTVRLAGDRIAEVLDPDQKLDANGKLIASLQPVFIKSKQTGGSRALKAATLCVVHQTGTANVSSNVNEFINNKSIHYLVDTDGQVIKFVHESQIAFHAGFSHWRNQDNVNTFSVGIEQVHNPGTPYPAAQLRGTQDLIARLIGAGVTGIVSREVVGHSDIATQQNAPFALGRKFGDPGPEFDWVTLRAQGFGLPLKTGIPLGGIYKGLFDKLPMLRLLPKDTDSLPRYGGRTDTGIPGGVIGELQSDLATIGYYCPVTGQYDATTIGAVGAFQEHFSASLPSIPAANKGTTDKRTAELIKQARAA